MSMTVTPDMLVQSFLKTTEDMKIPVLVVYGTATGVRVVSNVSPEREQAIRSWLTKVDMAAIIAAAKALLPGPAPADEAWVALDVAQQQALISTVKTVLAVTREHSGKTVDPTAEPVLAGSPS